MRYNRLTAPLNVWATAKGAFGPGPALLRPGTEIRHVTKDATGSWVFEARYESPHIAQRFDWTQVRTSITCDLQAFVAAPARAVGRPADGNEARTRTVAVPLRPDQLTRLKDGAKASGIPVTEYVRRIMEQAGAIPA